MEQKTEDYSDSENEIQFIEPLSMSAAVKRSDMKSSTLKSSQSSINYEQIGERIAGIVSAIITVCLIVGLQTTHLIFVFLPWMNSRVKEGYSSTDMIGIALWIGLGLMSVFVFMGLWSFTLALITSNRVKPDSKLKDSIENLKEDPSEDDKNNQESDVEHYRVKRWCKKCNQEKPIRAHHCSVCNVCVLRMDHHCPWINNCVGYRNHGHYLRFLFYVTLAMLTGLLLMASRLATFKGRYLYWGQRNGRFSIYLTDEMLQMGFLVADLVGCGILSLLIGLLLAVQLVNVSHGHTTIESLEISQCERDIRRQRRFDPHEGDDAKVPFPYDLGFESNFKAVFGGNRWLWPFPLPINRNPLLGSSSDGKSFKTRPDALMNGQWPLPSKDPLLLLSRRGSLTDGAGYIVKNVNYSL